MRDAFSLMEEISERPSIRYRPFAPLPDGAGPDEILDLHRSRLEDALPREKELKRSLVGPHRDELIFKLNDVEVRRFASQGQHRTFGMALKLAKFLYLKSRLDQTPILLLDDVFGDLDRHRSEVLLRLLEESSELGQSFITSAEDRTFRQTIDFDKNAHSTKLINKGAVVSSYA
jgi:DNA replication and repair protein RecF